MCGGVLLERLTNKYVPPPQKSVSYPNRRTSLWKFLPDSIHAFYGNSIYTQWNAMALIYTKISIRMQFHSWKLGDVWRDMV